MAIQDDQREMEIVRLLGLRAGAHRSRVDAFFEFSSDGTHYATPLELKSSTVGSVSTARDVARAHIDKWRSRVWLFGFYDSGGRVMEKLLMLGPSDMEPWIGHIESYIAPDIAIGERVARKLTLEDLHIICGEKTVYRLDDAKLLYKRQWPAKTYLEEMDIADGSGGYSPGKMLEILRLRAEYLIARGATLNNPQISKRFFAQFQDRVMVVGTDDKQVSSLIGAGIQSVTLAHPRLREIARNYALANSEAV